MGGRAKTLSDGGSRLRLQTSHLLPQLDCASGIGCLPDGTLIVANTGSHSLLMVHPDSGDVIGTYGKQQNASLRGPRGVVCDDTAIYVADCYNCVVKKISLVDGSIQVAGDYGEGEGQLRYPHGLALAPDGTLYVADTSNGRVVAFDKTTLAFKFAFDMNREPPVTSEMFDARLQALGKEAKWFGALAEKHVRPASLAILEDELFITDAYNRRLQVFSLSGTFLRFLQPTFAEGALRGQLLLTLAEGIAAANGRLYVSDKRGDAIHILRPSDGVALQYLPFLVSRPHALSGVCTDDQRVFVVDEVRSEVQVLTNLAAEATRKKPSSPRGAAVATAHPVAIPATAVTSAVAANRGPAASPRILPSTRPATATPRGAAHAGRAYESPTASARRAVPVARSSAPAAALQPTPRSRSGDMIASAPAPAPASSRATAQGVDGASGKRSFAPSLVATAGPPVAAPAASTSAGGTGAARVTPVGPTPDDDVAAFLSAYSGRAMKSPQHAGGLKAASRGGAEALRKKLQAKVKLEVII